MSKTIGENIAAIRKEKGITQDQLAKSVMVSAQAVSKWENGGMPDAELLPGIADCLGVSIDALFGRAIDDSSLEAALMKKIADTPRENVFDTIFSLCWDMEQAIFSYLGMESVPIEAAIEEAKDLEESKAIDEVYSGVQDDHGFTQMGIGKRIQYFLVVPDAKDKEKAFINGIDYVSLFKDLSDKNVFDTLIYLNKRDHSKIFTPSLLVKNLGMDEAVAENAIRTLKKYALIYTKQIELDDEIKDVYEFSPTPTFIAFLIFARELLDRPTHWWGNIGGRRKPYLA